MVMDGLKKELSDKLSVRKLVMTTYAMTPMLYTPTDKFAYLPTDTTAPTVKSAQDLAKTTQIFIML
eukprot:1717496-Heterocapsa_arctica.AAC.1